MKYVVMWAEGCDFKSLTFSNLNYAFDMFRSLRFLPFVDHLCFKCVVVD